MCQLRDLYFLFLVLVQITLFSLRDLDQYLESQIYLFIIVPDIFFRDHLCWTSICRCDGLGLELDPYNLEWSLLSSEFEPFVSRLFPLSHLWCSLGFFCLF